MTSALIEPSRLAIFLAAVGVSVLAQNGSVSAQAVSEQEAHDIGVEAYIYLYPLVTMDVTRRQATNIEPGKMVGRGPMNTFSHIRTYPVGGFQGRWCGRTSIRSIPRAGSI